MERDLLWLRMWSCIFIVYYLCGLEWMFIIICDKSSILLGIFNVYFDICLEVGRKMKVILKYD